MSLGVPGQDQRSKTVELTMDDIDKLNEEESS
jgi:hypothetical protein